jgi:hypothetical protein
MGVWVFEAVRCPKPDIEPCNRLLCESPNEQLKTLNISERDPSHRRSFCFSEEHLQFAATWIILLTRRV